MPLGDRYQDRGFAAAAGHELRTLGEAGFEELAEAGLGISDGPGFHGC
jgi:hypothetical protein